MAPPRPTPEASPADARRAAATRTAGAALVCSALALVLVGAGLWATVAGLAAAAAGLGLGVAALVRSRRADRRALLVVSAVAAILLGALGLLTGGARLALWPVAESYQRCVSSTLTLSGAAQCQQQLEDGIWDYLSGRSGAPASGEAPAASTSNASAGAVASSPRP